MGAGWNEEKTIISALVIGRPLVGALIGDKKSQTKVRMRMFDRIVDKITLTVFVFLIFGGFTLAVANIAPAVGLALIIGAFLFLRCYY